MLQTAQANFPGIFQQWLVPVLLFLIQSLAYQAAVALHNRLGILYEFNIWKLDLVKCGAFFMSLTLYISPLQIIVVNDGLSPCQQFLNTVLPSSPSYTQQVSLQIVDDLCWVTLQRFLSRMQGKLRLSAEPIACLIWAPPDLWRRASIGVLALGMALGRIWLQGMRWVCGC